jgi:orotate phosphoribosyltransferase
VISDEVLLAEAASDLVDLLVEAGGDLVRARGVMGPQTGATKLAELISLEIARRTGRPCFWASPAKIEHDTTRTMSFSAKEEELVLGNFLLPCEDVVTTAGSVSLAIDATIDVGGFTLPYVLALVNRSGLSEVRGKKIIALIEHEMPIWEAVECPPCKEGSEAILAKGENWARLTAEY